MSKTCKFILEYKEVIGNINLDFDNCNPPKHTMKHFVRLLKEIDDVRVKKMTDYPLEEIILIAFLAVLGNANGWKDIANFGKKKEKWLRKFLKLEYGIPSHDTLIISKTQNYCYHSLLDGRFFIPPPNIVKFIKKILKK